MTVSIVSSYYTALVTSMFIYRGFFHRLRNFPGPVSYRFTKFAHFASLVKGLASNNHQQAEELREKYGDIVRTGPNELTLFTPEGLVAIAGPGSKCSKGPWYDAIGAPWDTLQTTRNRTFHDKRRRTWDRGFGAKALRDYESRVNKYSEQLMSQLRAFSGKPFNASLWLNYYSFDVMGDLAFGQSFDMLKSGERHHALKIFGEAIANLGLLTPISWVTFLLLKVPNPITKFNDFCVDQVAARKQREPKEPDVMTWLIDAEKNGVEPPGQGWLPGDARLIIVAGSDTTAASLTHVIYHLANSPQVASKLREELRQIKYTPGSETEYRDLQDAKYLNGIINETLRLNPPVPSGVPRLSPPEGIEINGTFIPGGVTLCAPLYSLGRLESCFKHSKEFIPERWVNKPELILKKAAYAPFSIGPYGCVGKQLALMELRSIAARAVTYFDVGFAPGEDGKNLLEKSRDTFTLELKPLNVVFTERASEKTGSGDGAAL